MAQLKRLVDIIIWKQKDIPTGWHIHKKRDTIWCTRIPEENPY